VAWKLSKCGKCDTGQLVPFSGYGPGGAEIRYMVWACINPDCDSNINIDRGEVSRDRPMTDRSQRQRQQ